MLPLKAASLIYLVRHVRQPVAATRWSQMAKERPVKSGVSPLTAQYGVAVISAWSGWGDSLQFSSLSSDTIRKHKLSDRR